MRYAECQAQGSVYFTGVLEAGCKVMVGAHPKRRGMHWTGRGADAIIALRCCELSAASEISGKHRYKSHVHPNFILYFPFLKMVR